MPQVDRANVKDERLEGCLEQKSESKKKSQEVDKRLQRAEGRCTTTAEAIRRLREEAALTKAEEEVVGAIREVKLLGAQETVSDLEVRRSSIEV